MPNREVSPNRPGPFAQVSISEEEMETEAYKRYLGGGKEQWDRRGSFQLSFLKEMGLRSQHHLLDVGCGPLRAGRHFVEFLEPGSYWGADYNADFIKIGRRLVAADPALAEKRPTLRVLERFAFSELAERFDFVLAFSILNHAPAAHQRLFFTNLPAALRDDGRALVTHGWWFSESFLPTETPLRLHRVIESGKDLPGELEPSLWGWSKGQSIFPILELGRA